MNKEYEGLLPVDPIGAFDKIKEDYKKYFQTVFKFRDTDYKYLNDAKNSLLDKDDNLYKDPYIEVLPEYISENGDLDTLLQDPEYDDLRAKLPRSYTQFIKKGLMDYKPYKHQIEMLKYGYADGKNVVIKSGTGSGKTESFMLPLIASLLKEAETWHHSSYDPDWYTKTVNNGGIDCYVPNQRDGEADNRVAALRGLIMYPMNALVEDQMTRLRKTFDSAGVRDILNQDYDCNRIFFGRYNGDTMDIDAGTPLGSTGINRVRKTVEDSIALSQKYDQNNWANDKAKKDTIYISFRYPSSPAEDKISSEMITRMDMRAKAPDLLITNYSMLSIMLMRDKENFMFDSTREWYRDPNHIFHLILDELHLYRGSSGTEVALLLRAFLNRIGVPPVVQDERGNYVRNKQLRIYASSASLGADDVETHDFLEQFFGIPTSPANPEFLILDGTQYCPRTLNVTIDYSAFELFSEFNENHHLKYVIEDDVYKDSVRSSFCQRVDSTDIESFVLQNSEQIFYDLLSSMNTNSNGDVIPTSLLSIRANLFSNNEKALRGFLVFRADRQVVDALNSDDRLRLPRIRFHQFFKYIEGLWGELLPQVQGEEHVVGEVMYTPKDYVIGRDQKVHKVLELLRCESCGQLYIGGNKTNYVNAGQLRINLSLNSPELDRVPNMMPTPMVQNKVYSKYGIFWPTSASQYVPENRSKAILADTLKESTIDEDWREAFLNPYDGSVVFNEHGIDPQDMIHGFLYTVQQNGEETMALPSECPFCKQNYAKRKYSKSPIRNFRTGMKRNNQILSKELIYQLPTDGNNTKDRKLIGFSDSRQDAAEQAHGIAVEHFRDTVRMLFVDIITNSKYVPNSLRTLLQFIAPQAANPIFRPMLEQQIDTAIALSPELAAYSNDLKRLLWAGDVNGLSNYSIPSDSIKLSSLLHDSINVYDGSMIKALLKLGINPKGVKKYAQTVGNSDSHWSTAFNFDQLRGKTTADTITTEEDTFLKGIEDSLMETIYENCFGRFMGLSTEDSGIGYIFINEEEINENSTTYVTFLRELRRVSGFETAGKKEVSDFLSAYIRIMGDRHRYSSPDSELTPITSYNDLNSYYKMPIRKLTGWARGNHADEPLGNSLFSLLSQILIHQDFRLNHNKLSFHKCKESDLYYRCPSCGRIHLHYGMGICTNTFCNTPLVVATNDDSTICTVDKLWKSNYISYDILEEKREPCRIHTEELTGQTDDQAKRLLEFKGIILDEAKKNPIAAEIDMINVTTTMEVGVDIGSLLAVYQGNMPPTRYNYQQRVGRGGRRGQAYSAAVTFCRGKSHDQYYYKQGTDIMLGSVPASPKMALKPINGVPYNDNIVKRMIVREVLRNAFDCIFDQLLLLNINYSKDKLTPSDDTHGQFGYANLWNWTIPEASGKVFKSYLSDWINAETTSIDGERRIRSIIKTFIGIYDHNLSIENAEFMWIRNDLFDAVDAAVIDGTSNGIAQRLAEAGIMPMYGMPSNVRVMYHGSRDIPRDEISAMKFVGADLFEPCTIDRPLEMSISEFAPGSEKIKDHGYYTSAGLTIPFTTRIESLTDKSLDALEHSFTIVKNPTGEISDIVHGAPQNPDAQNIRLVIPKAYRTERVYRNKGNQDQNTDRKSFSQPSICVIANATSRPTTHVQNVDVDFWDCSRNATSNNGHQIWYINDNNGHLFKGKPVALIKNHTNRGVQRTIFSEPYVSSINVDPTVWSVNQNSPNFIIEGEIPTDRYGAPFNGRNFNVISGSEQKIAIGAKKQTEMIRLRLDPVNIPQELNLSLDSNSGSYEPAVKSAFYSAATLIQRVFADEIDISPDEIEISEVQKDSNGNPCIFLYDQLQNGSGYVKMLLDLNQNGVTKIEEIMREIVLGSASSRAFVRSLFSDEHKNCTTSCPNCIRTYQNAGYHHVLDWRLGIDLIKLMLDSTYKMGKDNINNIPYGDLANQIRIAGNIVAESHHNIVFDGTDTLSIRVGNNVYREKIVHPLWQHNVDSDQNYFELLRRPYIQKQGNIGALAPIAPIAPVAPLTPITQTPPVETRTTDPDGDEIALDE